MIDHFMRNIHNQKIIKKSAQNLKTFPNGTIYVN